jgi:serine protease Do
MSAMKIFEATLIAVLLIGSSAWTTFAAETTTRALDPLECQRQTLAIAPKILDATVGIVLTEEDIEANGVGYGGSGVIVSADGLVLTAAHVLEGCGDEVIALLPKNRHVRARVCGYLGRGDLGVLQLVEPGPWPFLPMAEVETVPSGTLCVGAGHTGRIDPQRPAPLRMGRVLGERRGESFVDENGDAADLDRVLVTDAPFLPGDSGGPLVNLAGEVIGVHSSIGQDHRENLHVPIWQFQRHWAKLTGGVKRALPKADAGELAKVGAELQRLGLLRKQPVFDYRVTIERSWSTSHPNFLKKLSPLLEKSAGLPVQIFADDRPIALGCVVTTDGLIATAAANLGEGKLVCRIGERDYDAEVAKRDEANNLALLKIAAEKLPVVAWSDETPAVGTWVITPNAEGKPLSVGLIGLSRRAIPDPELQGPAAVHGFLGIELKVKAKDARIGRVLSDSAASTAGLQADDVVLSLNEHAVRRGEELIEALRRFKPDDEVKLEVLRGEEKLQLEAKLGRRPNQQQEDDAEFAAWNRSSGGVSPRKANLPDVLTHDGIVAPRYCGGPLLDLQGRVIGLNIARADRTSTYALPADVVQKMVEKVEVSP